MPVDSPCKRRGLGRTENAARASIIADTERIGRRFNAAELIDVGATNIRASTSPASPLQPRQLQQYTWLEIAGDWHQRCPFQLAYNMSLGVEG